MNQSIENQPLIKRCVGSVVRAVHTPENSLKGELDIMFRTPTDADARTRRRTYI